MNIFAQRKCRIPHLPGKSIFWSLLWFVVPAACCTAQETTPKVTPPASKEDTAKNSAVSTQAAPPSASNAPQDGLPPDAPVLHFNAEGGQNIDPTGNILAYNVTLQYAGVTITADRMEGNLGREVTFSGNARLVTNGLKSQADAIHFFPRTRTYRMENPRAVLDSSLLQGRSTDPLFVRGGEIYGSNTGYTEAENTDTTTCIEIRPHYELRARSSELIPDKRLVLRRVAVYFFGQKLIVIPEIVVPLDPRRPRRPRTDYLPEFGRNAIEGYFARFPYTFAIGAAAATFIRLDETERLGPGYRFEQDYVAGKQGSLFSTAPSANTNAGFNFGNITSGQGTFGTAYGYGSVGNRFPGLGTGLGPQSGGVFALQGYLNDGFDRNFNASFRHQQGIGSNNRFGFSTELQKNSSYNFSDQTTQNTRFNFAHNDAAHGVTIDSNLTYNTNDSDNFSTSQLTGNLRPSFDFAVAGSNRNNFSANFDLSRSLSDSSSITNRSARLDSQLQFQHASRDYSFSILGNKSSPIGFQSDHSAFGTLERLPEIQFSSDTIGFQGGWLKKVPARLDIGAGQYSEPGTNTNDDRVLVGLTLQEQSIARGNTEISTGGGFEQRYYGDGAAQYILRNTTRLRQRLGGRSGFDLNYQYQEPRGGTPFQFDTFPRSHYITAEGGYLNDPRFQLTARVGYDFLGTSRANPWQSLSTRLMWRPNLHTRFDALATYDPNTSRFFSASASLRLRGRRDFEFDLFSRYDPNLGRFSQVNAQFDVPFGRTWRTSGLLRYNGLTGQLESTNLQVVKRWDCMEASLTYTATPFGFRNEESFYFAIRLTAFPFFRSFARGPAGDALGAGLGDLY